MRRAGRRDAHLLGRGPRSRALAPRCRIRIRERRGALRLRVDEGAASSPAGARTRTGTRRRRPESSSRSPPVSATPAACDRITPSTAGGGVRTQRPRRRPGDSSRVSAGPSHTCGVRGSGEVSCWGNDYFGQATPPGGRFVSVSAGERHTCGVLRATRRAACWGSDSAGQSSPPGGRFVSVSAGVSQSCGLRPDGSADCWGRSASFDEPLLSVSVGGHPCGVTLHGSVVCRLGDDPIVTPPSGMFVLVSAGRHHACGVRGDGSVACWGDDEHGQATPPAGAFLSVSAGVDHSCGVRAAGVIACWGSDASRRAGAFTPGRRACRRRTGLRGARSRDQPDRSGRCRPGLAFRRRGGRPAGEAAPGRGAGSPTRAGRARHPPRIRRKRDRASVAGNAEPAARPQACRARMARRRRLTRTAATAAVRPSATARSVGSSTPSSVASTTLCVPEHTPVLPSTA